MRFKRLGRMGATGGLVAAALATSIVVTPSSASAADDGWLCYGKEVKRCAMVYWDNSNRTFRAKAKITDVAGAATTPSRSPT